MYDLPEDEAGSEYVSELIEQGALILDSVDADGEIFFRVNNDRMKEVAPEYWNALIDDGMKELEDVCISLFEKDVLELDIQDDGSIEYTPTEAGYQYLSEHAEPAV